MSTLRIKDYLRARDTPAQLLEDLRRMSRTDRGIILDWDEVELVSRLTIDKIVSSIGEMQKETGTPSSTFTFSNMNPTLAGFTRASSYRNRVRIEVHEPARETPRLYERHQWWRSQCGATGQNQQGYT